MRKFIKILLSIIILIFLSGLVYSVTNIILWKKSIDDNKKIMEEVKENIILENDEYKINFDELKKQNSDVVAYLKVEGTNIDYIVVKGNDNKYYLKHNLDKEYSSTGWVFADYHNNYDGNDKNLVIYGHNTKDGSMFGSLKNVLDRSWQENKDNLLITLVTTNGVYWYRVFSTYIVDVEDYYINTEFKGNEYKEFIDVIKSRSNYDYDVIVNEDDDILTLSSCYKTIYKRVVLHAKLIKTD